MQTLKVHPGGRYLMWEDGSPFFYLGDTAWELFHRLTRGEADRYLTVRARQGFTVIQAVALAEHDGLGTPNAYGRLPLLDLDPTRPDLTGENSYWDHVDWTVRRAADLGLFVALLPTWGDKYNLKWGVGPEIFTPENARAYAQWLSQRYRDQWNIIWMLGGDRPLETPAHRAVIDAMGAALREGDGSAADGRAADGRAHLITFHPMGGHSSVDEVPGRDYVDFNTVQSGHGLEGYASWQLVRRTGEAETKPFMDAEPRYEDHPACFRPDYGYLWNADDVRQNTYWDVFEGTCGHTYGNHSIWSFNTVPQAYWPYRWEDVLLHPGAEQVQHVVTLRLSRPYFELRPAPELVVDDAAAMAHQSAARGDGYAYIYSPLGLPIRARLESFADRALRASWFDPRTGQVAVFAIVPPRETLFVPPTCGKGCDWVLVLDVTAARAPAT
jgi:hypothetical protein